MATQTSILPGKFHGQRSLAGYSPWGCKELDMTGHSNMLGTYLFYETFGFNFSYLVILIHCS